MLNMKVFNLVVLSLVTAVAAAPEKAHEFIGSKCAPQSVGLTARGLKNLKEFVGKNGYGNTTCTLENAAVRKEWCVQVMTVDELH